MASNPPTTNIKLLSATQIPAGPSGSNCTGGWPSCAQTTSPYPAVLGDFLGNGKQQVAAVVQAHHPLTYAISVEVPGTGFSFTPAITDVTASEFDPIFVGSLKNDSYDDLVMIHQPATYEVFLNKRDGSGTFTSQGTNIVTTTLAVGGTLMTDAPTGCLDLLLVDGGNPGNVWTAAGQTSSGKCTGTFGTPSSVAIDIQLETDNPFNTVVFGNFAAHVPGQLDFASNDPTKQVHAFINNGSGTAYADTALQTPDGYYDSCFDAAGNLSGHSTALDLVSANCFDNYMTIYVNNGSGTFATGVYYPSVFGSPTAVSIANLRGSNKPNDIVSTNAQSGDVSILLGNGDGTVDVGSVGFVTGGHPITSAVVTDLNGDGIPDLVVPDNEYSFVYLQGNGDGTFGSDIRSGVNYYAQTGNGPQAQGASIASGDFNGDGIPDFVIGNTNNSPTPNASITVFLSKPDGTYQPGVNYSGAATANLQYVAVADFNHDGKLDIAATDGVNGGVQIFTGNGDGTFTVGATYSTDTTPCASNAPFCTVGIVAADFNGDGWPDIAVVNNPTATTADVGVLLNDGKTGTFGNPTNYRLSNVGTEITAGNLGSGKISLAVPLYGYSGNAGSAVAIFAGNGNGTFGTESDVPLVNGATTYYNPYAVAIGDLNRDGIPDLAVTIQDQTTTDQCDSGYTPCQGIAVVLQNPVGTFAAPVLLSTTLQDPVADNPVPASVVIADMNGDGILDLAYTNSKFGTAGILYGKGAGAFYDPVEFLAGRWAYNLAVTGVNGVGSEDVVVTGWENSLDFSGITVLMNTGDTGTSVTSSPNPSTVGTSVTLTATVAARVKGVSGPPTGTVTFYDGSNPLGRGTLVSGTARYSTSSLLDGSHNITAVYGGDGGHAFLSSTSSVLVQVVHEQDPAALGQQVDYFGEGKSDFTVWRPSTGMWYSTDGSGHYLFHQWGAPTDIPQVGDYDGDGKTDMAVWRPSNGTWYIILSSTGKVVSRQWGSPTDKPVPGDYDGDGKTDYAVWRPSTGTWYVIQSSTGKIVSQQFGMEGDIPVPGDYDGDGRTDFAVWRPSTGTWYIILSSTGQVVSRQWGAPTDKPVPGDYDGDGKTDIAVWRPSTGTWYVIQSSTGKIVSRQWGGNGDVPVPRDYDGDGKTDFAVWRPSNGTWYVIESSNGKVISQQWGAPTDIPMNKPVGQ